MIHSFSSLKLFRQCPRKFYEHKVLKLHPYTESPATAHGNRVHAALEQYLKDRTPIPEDLSNYAWVCTDIIETFSPHALAEVEFAFRRDGTPCAVRDWNNKHFMGKADVLDFLGNHVMVVDYKTGKSGYPDVDQLELMALFVFLKYPTVEVVTGLLFFLDDGIVVPNDGSARWTRADVPTLLAKWQAQTDEVERHVATGVWPTIPSPLCGWCECTTCPNQAPALAKREAKAARFGK